MPVLTDGIREADTDNPKGYYEFERVKQLDEGDHGWLPDAQGKAVKVISALLEHLPDDYNYRVIFMERSIDEILASQRKMLIRRGEDTDKVSDEELARLFAKHVQQVKIWLHAQPNIALLLVNYNEMLKDPRSHAAEVNRFLDDRLDLEQMVAVIDPSLYRNRA